MFGCAFLPLTVVLAGKLIASYGAGWETDIIPLLRESQSEEVESHIISVTISSIRGPQASDVQHLFRLMALFAEDALIPVRIVILLVESQNGERCPDNAQRRRSHLRIRERVNILLGRSLLLGSLHSGIRLLETTPFKPTNDSIPEPGMELHWYCSRFLIYHAASALHPEKDKVQLHEEDGTVLGWITVEEEQLRARVCEAYGIERITSHAKRLFEQSKHSEAGLWFCELGALWTRQNHVPWMTRNFNQQEALTSALRAFEQLPQTQECRLRQAEIHLNLAGQYTGDRPKHITRAKRTLADIDLTTINIETYARIALDLNLLSHFDALTPVDDVNEKLRQLKLFFDRVGGESLRECSARTQAIFMAAVVNVSGSFYSIVVNRRDEIDLDTLKEVTDPRFADQVLVVRPALVNPFMTNFSCRCTNSWITPLTTR
eukprot:g2572.t1